jgi:hypothetical protein
MLRLWGLYVLLLVFAAPAMAQVTPENPEPQPQPTVVPAAPAPRPSIPRWDLSGGYTLQAYRPATGAARIYLQGWYASVNYNYFSWLGIEGQFSGDYKFQGSPNANIGIYGAMAGPRIYPFRHHKLEPWAHILFGGAIYVSHYPPFSAFPNATYVYDSKALEAGGGFDLNRWSHWGIRLIEIDYERTQFGGSNNQSSYSTQAGYRVAAGFTYRFGEK